jgi:pheromone shutdown protein TraB
MRKIIVIGTLHAGLTPKNELKDILSSYKPDQLLVEIQEKDIQAKTISSYSDEMVFAYEWAKENNILVIGFDVNINILKEGKTQADNQRVIEKQKAIIHQHDWKDFNQNKYLKLLDEFKRNLVDGEKWKEREKKMLSNILDNVINTGVIVVLTGAGHIPFFIEHLKDAEFPLVTH